MELNALQMMRTYTPGKTPSLPNKNDDAALREATREFEAIFIEQMLKSMRQTVEKSGLMDGGMAEDIFEDMLYENYAKKMSQTANLGLGDMLYRQISQNHTLPGE
jgi:peptidoglycan hydrolase FlgJ